MFRSSGSPLGTGSRKTLGYVLVCLLVAVAFSILVFAPQQVRANGSDWEIKIIKDAVPNDQQDFTFTRSWGDDFILDDDGDNSNDYRNSRSFDLDEGTYTVTESGPPSGWALTGLTCSNKHSWDHSWWEIDIENRRVTIHLVDTDDEVTCTFTDTKRGHIIVDTVTTPSGDPQVFAFSTTGTDYAPFSLTHASPPNDQALSNGWYSVQETVPSGWTLEDLSCDEPGTTSSTWTIDKPNAIVTVHLLNEETVTCTFTDTKRGHIVVDKVTSPSADPQSFDFTTTGTGYNVFSLTDTSPANDQTLTPGSYSVTETVPSDWDLTTLTCTSSLGTSTITITKPKADITLAAGDTVSCTFTDTKRGHIVVDKVTEPSGDSQSFSFTTTGTGYSVFSLKDTDTPNDQTLTPGSYSVTETVPSDWDLTTLTCTSSLGTSTITITKPKADITLAAGDTVSCTFTDTKRGTIIVEKQTIPADDPATFTFAGDASGTIGDDGQIVVGNLVPGTYTSTEDDPTLGGFDLTSIVCDDGGSATPSTGDVSTRTATFNLDPGEIVKCTFTDTKASAPLTQLIVIKHVIKDNAGTKIASDFTIVVTADNPNPSTFQGVEAPGVTVTLNPGDYSVDELDNPWHYTKSLSGDCSGTIQAGETKTCTITNYDPQLIVYKHVMGGTKVAGDFTIHVTGSSPPLPATFPGSEDGTTIILAQTSSYAVSEDPVEGYVASYSADCTGWVGEGQLKICTITNEYSGGQPPQPPVGGELYSPNRLALLEPWLTLLAIVGLLGMIFIMKRRREA